jgi:DNA-binding NtrC family response regulator
MTGKMLDALLNHRWPGNVRELQNVLYQYIVLNKFDLGGTPGRWEAEPLIKNTAISDSNNTTLHAALENFEKDMIIRTLDLNRWHREKTASSLGLPPRTFFRKMQKYGLTRQK